MISQLVWFCIVFVLGVDFYCFVLLRVEALLREVLLQVSYVWGHICKSSAHAFTAWGNTSPAKELAALLYCTSILIAIWAYYFLNFFQVSDFFSKLIQRVAPKSYQQAFGEVYVTQKFLENFSGDQVFMILLLLYGLNKWIVYFLLFHWL